MKKSGRITVLAAVVLLIVALSATLGACSLFQTTETGGDYTFLNVDPNNLEAADVGEKVAAMTVSSVVQVRSEFKRTSPFVPESAMAGAGFFISASGYLVTNSHVVYDADYNRTGVYSVTTLDGTSYDAALIAHDPELDIAVLKVDAGETALPFLTLLDSDKNLLYGQTAFAVGNPENIGIVFSRAVIACPSVSVDGSEYPSVLLDANINHGNSGGPLVDTSGRVIGVVNARADNSGSQTVNDIYGLGLAIPSHFVINYLDGLASKGVTYTLGSGAKAGGGNGSQYLLGSAETADTAIGEIVAANTVAATVQIIAQFGSGSAIFGKPAEGGSAAGAGFFISASGYVVTNSHVVYDSENRRTGKYSVRTLDGKVYSDVTLVGHDPELDIAVLKINTYTKFPYLKFADDASAPTYGQKVYAVGNPENIGIVFSGATVAYPELRTEGETYPSIVLDTNINHGNSGGPLVNIPGYVVGVVNARLDNGQKNNVNDIYGLGLAIPADDVTAYLDTLKDKGVTYEKATPAVPS